VRVYKPHKRSPTEEYTVTVVNTPESDVRRFLRGILVLVSAGLLIGGAYINYELWHRFSLNPIVTMAISLQLFAIAIVVLILAVGPAMFEKRPSQ
jgi:hypothetical protein